MRGRNVGRSIGAAALTLAVALLAGGCAHDEGDGSLTRAQVEERLSVPSGFVLPLPESLPNGYRLLNAGVAVSSSRGAEVEQADFLGDGSLPSVHICAERRIIPPRSQCGTFQSDGGTIRRDVNGVLLVVRMYQKDVSALDQWKKVSFTTDYDRLGWLKD